MIRSGSRKFSPRLEQRHRRSFAAFARLARPGACAFVERAESPARFLARRVASFGRHRDQARGAFLSGDGHFGYAGAVARFARNRHRIDQGVWRSRKRGNRGRAVTGGIAEALIATACGLGIAIFALIPFNFFTSRVSNLEFELQTAATNLEVMLGSHSATREMELPVERPRPEKVHRSKDACVFPRPYRTRKDGSRSFR